jgi:hypothetical protein
MPIVNLLYLNLEDENARHAFAHEHLMAHRALRAKLSPAKRAAALPLVLDPMQDENMPASNWHLNHQTAHNQVRGSINSDQILRDSNLFDEEARLWWTFINHQEHMLLAASKSG